MIDLSYLLRLIPRWKHASGFRLIPHWKRLSLHAAEEMEDDGITIQDLESIILTGIIVERQKDRETDETKIVIRGRTLDGRQAEAVIKVSFSGILYIITVYLI